MKELILYKSALRATNRGKACKTHDVKQIKTQAIV